MNHNAMQGIGGWALPQRLSDLNNLRRTTTYYKVFCRLAKLTKVKSATLQRFQLAFKHLLLLEKNSRLHTIFQDSAFNFHTFFQVWKSSSQISRLFQEFKTLYEPCVVKSSILGYTVSLVQGQILSKIWLSLCLFGCIRFARYCGKMYSRHLYFPMVD